MLPGREAADDAFSLPAMMFGPEALGLGPSLAAIDPYAGLTRPPNVAVGLDNPTVYHPWSESAAQDLYSAFAHGEPTTTLQQHLADMATHYVGDNPDRVVLGKWGIIKMADTSVMPGVYGGIFFDTGDETFNAMRAGGLDKPTEQALVWPDQRTLSSHSDGESNPRASTNVLDHDEYDSLEDMAEARGLSYSSYEVNYLNQRGGQLRI